MIDDPPKQQTTVQLDYAPRSPRRRRRTLLLWSGLLLLLLLAGIAHWQRYLLLHYWREGRIAWIRWQCLHDAADPDTVVYEEEPGPAQKLIARSGYARLSQGAAARPCPRWPAMTATMADAYCLPQQYPGGAVFLHERYTPSGKRVLVYANYSPSRASDGRGELQVLILGVQSLSSKPDRLGGMSIDDVSLFYPTRTRDAFSQLLPHPEKHKLRLFAAQPDPSDRTQFWFDYEVDGRRARATLRILDPYTAAQVPNWPPDWPRVEVVHPAIARKPAP